MKSIAFLGLSPIVERQLKTLIAEYLDHSLSWVSARDPNVEGVIINADFITSPQVQKYIDKTDANVVCCHKNSDAKRQAILKNIPSLHVEDHDETQRLAWLQALTGERKLTSKQQPKPEPKESLPEKSQASASTNYTELLEHIQQPNILIETYHENYTTWIDTGKKEVYSNQNRSQTPGIEHLSWRKVDKFSADYQTNNDRGLSLELWLFETIWQSAIEDGMGHISKNNHYRITRWPRPLSTKGRTEALRLAAFLQSSAADIDSLCQKTGYSVSMVTRFLCATHFANQLSVAEVGKQPRQSKVATVPVAEAEKKQKLSLLSRFRKKLGLG